MALCLAQTPERRLERDGEISDVVRHVRELALKRLRRQIAIACDDNARSRVVDRVARLALAAIDGAFVAASVDPSITLAQILELLPDALVAARQAGRQRTSVARSACSG